MLADRVPTCCSRPGCKLASSARVLTSNAATSVRGAFMVLILEPDAD
jgi:hypothetical protein